MNDNVRFGVFAVIAVVLPLALGTGLGWPAWAYLIVIVVLLLIVGVWRSRALGENPAPAWWAPPADPLPAVQTAPVKATVGSSIDGYRFQFSATVRWHVIANQRKFSHPDPASLAKDALLQRAAAITTTFAPTDHVLAQHQVAAALGTQEHDQRSLVQVSAVDVDLTVPEEEREAVRAMADQLRQVRLTELSLAGERSVREYLHDEALRSTGSALVWWLARHPEDVEHAAGLIDKLRLLSAVAQDGEDPGRSDGREVRDELAVFGGSGGPDDLLTDLLDTMFPNPDPRRVRFAHEFANLAADFHPDTANRIRRLFGLHVVKPDDPEQDVPPPADQIS